MRDTLAGVVVAGAIAYGLGSFALGVLLGRSRRGTRGKTLYR